MLILVFFQIFLSTIKAEYPGCQFVSCFPDRSYSSRSCEIHCKSKQFPILDSSMKKNIFIFKFYELENIPKYAFQFLEINYLYIDARNLKFIEDDAFTKIKKLNEFELTNVRNISLILNAKIFNYLSDFTTSLTITNARIKDNHLLVLLDQIKTWTKLETLILDENLIENFNYDFNIFKSFNRLSLSDNLIETFNIKSQSLISLNLASNRIAKLEKEIFQALPSLEYLKLGFNKIKEIYNETFLSNTRLYKIYLQFNSINYIEPNSFCMLKSLGILSLTRNNLSSIKLYCLQDLIDLYLGNVGYEGEIDLKRIGDPINLEGLDLSGNNINKININEKMEYLTGLDLSSNNISDIDKNTTKFFPNLSYLDISYNKFTQEIFNSINSLKKLIILFMSNNLVTSIKPSYLAENENLNELDLDSNQIENVEFPLLERLQFLYLRNNKLRIINEASFSMFKSIQRLNLDSNLISQINSKAFFKNAYLSKLSLSNNFLTTIPELKLSVILNELNLKNNSISF